MEGISAAAYKEYRSKDVQFERDFGRDAFREFVDRNVFFGTNAFVMCLEGHVFTDLFDDGGAGDVEASIDIPGKKRSIDL